MKPVIPTLRGKKRYVIIEAQPLHGKALRQGALAEELTRAFRRLVGSVSAARAHMRFLADISTQSRITMRVERSFVAALRAAVCLTQRIEDAAVILRTITVSGSLHKASAQKA